MYLKGRKLGKNSIKCFWFSKVNILQRSNSLRGMLCPAPQEQAALKAGWDSKKSGMLI